MRRCAWAQSSAHEQNYHDREWCVPTTDERELFELLILEGMQAGLSWVTVLKKRAAFQQAFDNFDVEKVARYDEDKIQQLLSNEQIIRNRLKVRAAVKNAQEFIRMQEEHNGFAPFLWQYVDGVPIQNSWESMSQLPASTPLSDRISKDLKKRGFSFVGSTIVYSYMQAAGLVNDHLTCCDWHEKVKAMPAPYSGTPS